MSKPSDKRKRFILTVAGENQPRYITARTENEARRLWKKHHPSDVLVSVAVVKEPQPKAAKPKAKHPVQAKAKPAKAPAVQATPENIKALAKEAITEYVREGIGAFLRGLFGAR